MVVAAFFALQKTCSSDDALIITQRHLQPDGANKNNEDANSGEKSSSPQRDQPKPMATFNLRITEHDEIEGHYYAENGREKSDWVHKFICETKIGEFALAVFTFFLVLFTGGLWWSTARLWTAGERQIAATQRPWVKVNQIAPASDLVFENGEATPILNVDVGNYGNSPGLRVRINAAIIASNERNIFQAQRDFARQFRQPAETDVPELTSWRGDQIGMPVIARMDAAELRRCQEIAARSDFPVLMLSIIGCITYEFSFTDGWHQTGLLYMLRKFSPYPGALLHDEIANAQGAVRPEGRISEQDFGNRDRCRRHRSGRLARRPVGKK